eukprot:s7702_g2.t1
MDYRALQPRSSVNTNRATGQKRERSAGSGPAAIKQQAAKYLGKALKSGARTVMERHSQDPFTAYNNARFGISISGLEQLMVFAQMRIANPPRTKKMIEDRADLTLTNHCYVAFIDRIVGFFQDEVQYAVERGENVPELVIPADPFPAYTPGKQERKEAALPQTATGWDTKSTAELRPSK